MAQQNQKALVLTGLNGDWVIEERPIPKPGPEQLLVKIDSAALNPIDWKNRLYGILVNTFPAILGIEAAGTVVEVGSNVRNFAKGDKVFYQGTYIHDEATYQQYSVILAAHTGKIPSNLSLDDAATLPIGTGTAIVGLYANREGSGAKQLTPPWKEGGAGLYKGKPILIFGGSSSVGQYAIQLAKLSGFSPIIATASPHNADLVKSLGATHVLDRDADVVAEVRAITHAPLEIVFDAIAVAGTQEQAWEILAPGGTLAITLLPTFDKEKYPDNHFVRINGTASMHPEIQDAFSKHFPKLLEDGLLKPNPVKVVEGGLLGIEVGLKQLYDNKVSGHKLVVHPHETP